MTVYEQLREAPGVPGMLRTLAEDLGKPAGVASDGRRAYVLRGPGSEVGVQ